MVIKKNYYYKFYTYMISLIHWIKIIRGFLKIPLMVYREKSPNASKMALIFAAPTNVARKHSKRTSQQLQTDQRSWPVLAKKTKTRTWNMF